LAATAAWSLIDGAGQCRFRLQFSAGMYRGWIDADGSWVAIYGDETETEE
jgi:beta-aspartyl-peptidase (threonine type)